MKAFVRVDGKELQDRRDSILHTADPGDVPTTFSPTAAKYSQGISLGKPGRELYEVVK